MEAAQAGWPGLAGRAGRAGRGWLGWQQCTQPAKAGGRGPGRDCGENMTFRSLIGEQFLVETFLVEIVGRNPRSGSRVEYFSQFLIRIAGRAPRSSATRFRRRSCRAGSSLPRTVCRTGAASGPTRTSWAHRPQLRTDPPASRALRSTRTCRCGLPATSWGGLGRSVAVSRTEHRAGASTHSRRRHTTRSTGWRR